MKRAVRFFTAFLAFVALAACNGSDPDYPDAELELAAAKLNSDINSLNTLLTALAAKDSLLAVEQFIEGGQRVGKTLLMQDAGEIPFYARYDLQDWKVPEVGLKQSGSGYEWTVDGAPCGSSVPEFPVFKYSSGKWSIDPAGKGAWQEHGKPVKGFCRPTVRDLTYGSKMAVITLVKDEDINIPFVITFTEPDPEPDPWVDPDPHPDPDPDPDPHPQPDPEPVVVSGSQPGWYELPVMNLAKSGKYYVSSTDNSLYYAMHMCAGGEKDGYGKTARNYTVCFSAQYHCPLWVAAPLHSMYKGSGRHDNYKPDPNIPAEPQWSSTSSASGFNKGHMLGSADRNKTTATNHQVFNYSNIAPQLSAGFNTGGGGWNTLEDWIDDQYCTDTLYAVIGCYFGKFTDGYRYTVEPRILSGWGRNDVAMPTMFYYVLLRTKSGNTRKAIKDCSASELKCAAFVRSHTNSLKGQDVTSAEMMSVADLEAITGVTYFANVPQAPKTVAKASDWGL